MVQLIQRMGFQTETAVPLFIQQPECQLIKFGSFHIKHAPDLPTLFRAETTGKLQDPVGNMHQAVYPSARIQRFHNGTRTLTVIIKLPVRTNDTPGQTQSLHTPQFIFMEHWFKTQLFLFQPLPTIQIRGCHRYKLSIPDKFRKTTAACIYTTFH